MRNLAFLAILTACAAVPSSVLAERPRMGILKQGLATRGDVWAQAQASARPWHGQYYYMPYGQPTALVVPPTAVMQQNYSWGVSQNTMTPIYHQYGAAAVPSAGGPFYATPRWPSHTNQFGVYPVRGPW
ncbi:MAG: hypothetical protein KDA45_02245 [Planctomycetales bacterium]|nr:hypothetical protein [Planctomycetales bacterium]